LFAEVLDEAGVPAGVFNLVNGDGPTVGEAMSAHPGIDMMSFTGSTRAGIAVAKAASDTVKRVAQELGGKSANIVLDDADLQKAIPEGVMNMFSNSGQSCNAPSRMFVPRAKQDEVIAIAKATAEKVKVGDPFAEGTRLGPVVSETQFNKIQRLIQAGIDEGATLVTGGVGRPEGLNRGYYVRPTIFADVRNDMTIAREEIFGPVLAVLKAADFDDALRLANDSEYGLTGSYYGKANIDRAKAEFYVGNLYINRKCTGALVGGHPFGGFDMSGTNAKAGGRDYLRLFLEAKVVSEKT
jgi:aldehyde dehydrogenase (NAD+)